MKHKLSQQIDTLYPDLQRYAHSLSDSADQAEELLQQAVLRVLNRAGGAATVNNLQRYMFLVLRNLHRDILRKKQRHQPMQPEAEPHDPAISAAARLACAQVVQRINALPPPYAQVLQLLQSGQSYAQIAARLNLPLGTIMSRISRARRALRLSLGLGPNEGVATLLA